MLGTFHILYFSAGSAAGKKFCVSGRPKSAEPGSPLLRRALSPDRIHPRVGSEGGPGSKKAPQAISPLCSPSCKVVVTTTPKLTISTQNTSGSSSGVAGPDVMVSPLPSRALHTSPLAADSHIIDQAVSASTDHQPAQQVWPMSPFFFSSTFYVKNHLFHRDINDT